MTVSDVIERAQRDYAKRHPSRQEPTPDEVRDFIRAIRVAAIELQREIEEAQPSVT